MLIAVRRLPSLLHHPSLIPPSRHRLLPSRSLLARHPLPLQRPFSSSTFGRIPFWRLPVALGAAGAGAVGYIQYKVSGTLYLPSVEGNVQLHTIDRSPLDHLLLIIYDIATLSIQTNHWIHDKFTKLANEVSEEFDHLVSFLSDVKTSVVSKASSLFDDAAKEKPQPPENSKAAAFQESDESSDKDDKDRSHRKIPGMDDEDFMVLTRKLIEVRNILKAVQHNDALRLPSIVVVGSQSSGKSSVLETIVGHEFLPKGNNMVTRRPLELTLIHTPGSNEEYGEFPQLGFGKVSNFRSIQKTLVDLNNAVPASECVSDKPIELRIYSPNVPDLTLIDLPGYVQINSKNQPATLKEQIAALCDKYIQEPNIILAVCAADVDLANSEALRASRKVDPLGWRTIGVITKMDLVEPQIGAAILRNSDYPLHLGYVGVVCKPPISARLGSNANHSKAIIKSEESFFSHHPEYKARDIAVGTRKLRRLLMEVLEESMGRRLYSISDAVRTELDETNYQFKVQYNDRRITAESYLAETMDTLKHRFKDFARQFGKPQVRAEVRKMLEQRVVDICEQLYWMDPKVNELGTKAATAEEYYWQNKLTTASSALTKSGVGRSSTQLVVDLLMSNMERLVSTDPFIYHPDARRKVLQLCNEIIRHKFYTTVDQVENTIKPYKFEVECTDLEWVDAAKRTFSLLEREINQSQKLFDAIKANIGRRKLNSAMKYLSDFDSSQSPTSKPPVPLPTLPLPPTDEPSRSSYPDTILHPAREALYHRHRINALKNRLYYLKSRSCKSPDCQIQCPEIFLNCVAEKLTYTAVMFIYVELLNEFFFQVPRDVDGRLYYDLSKQEIQNFARENQLVCRHLELMERKQSLEMAMEKLGWLIRRQEDLARKRSGERRGQDVDVRESGLRDQ